MTPLGLYFWLGVALLLAGCAAHAHERLRYLDWRLQRRIENGFVCYHGLPIVDCIVCRAGVTKDEFTRADRRRTERHNVKIAKRIHERKRWAKPDAKLF